MHENSGRFSVKSMYREQVNGRLVGLGMGQTEVWKKLWKLRMHERLKLLLWRVYCDILPTKGKIASRIGVEVGEENRCSLCGGESETSHHLFLRCAVSQVVWREAPWPLDISAVECDSIGDWIRKIILPEDELGVPDTLKHHFQIYAANALNFVWASRNRAVHRRETEGNLEVARKVVRVSNEHATAWKKQEADRPRLLKLMWMLRSKKIFQQWQRSLGTPLGLCSIRRQRGSWGVTRR